MHPCEVSSAKIYSSQSQQCNKRSFNIDRYKPINFSGICGYPNALPPKIRFFLPKFNGIKDESAERHLQQFMNVIDDFEIDHEDVVMRLFVQSLDEDARDWFSYLPAHSVSSWHGFKSAFLVQYGERISEYAVISNFMYIHIEEGELIPAFNLRFMRALNRIPECMRPNDALCLVVYLGAFDKKMSYRLRDKEPTTLHQAHQFAIDIENNWRYGIQKGYFSKKFCCPTAPSVNERFNSGVDNECQSIHTPVVPVFASFQVDDVSVIKEDVLFCLVNEVENNGFSSNIYIPALIKEPSCLNDPVVQGCDHVDQQSVSVSSGSIRGMENDADSSTSEYIETA